MILENLLKKTRKEKRITQVKLAQKSYVSIRAYQNYEAGKRVPDVYAAQRMAKGLGVKVEYLFPLHDVQEEPDKAV